MKLEPLFDLQDLLYGSDALTVAYLFETDKTVFKESDSIQGHIGAMAEITEASEIPYGNSTIDQVDLPFGIGDVFHLQEPFRVYAWDLDMKQFRFEYKDGSVSVLIEIFNDTVIMDLAGNTNIRRGTCNMNPLSLYDQKEIRRICRWHPSCDMPREAMRIIKTVKSVTPMRFANVSEDLAYIIWRKSKNDAAGFIRDAHPDFNNGSWLLIVELHDPEIPHVDLW